jgi:hypothetical protein
MNIDQFARDRVIINEVKKGTYPGAEQLLEKISQLYDNLAIITGKEMVGDSESTLKKDFKRIRLFYGISIRYSRLENGYFIENPAEYDHAIDEMLESINLYYLIDNQNEINQYVKMEPRKMQVGKEYFFQLLAAIKEKKKVQFTYHYYSGRDPEQKLVSPLGLKEFKGFWYLVAKDGKDIKSYGLDRIKNLTNSMEKADYPNDFSLEEYYKHCYGIVRFDNQEPEKILLKVEPIKAAYYKANPLHPSQKIEEETSEYSIISLYVYFNYDLKQELRSHVPGEVEVLRPKVDLNEERYY